MRILEEEFFKDSWVLVRDTERGSVSPETVTYEEGRDVGEEGMLCVISDFSDRSHVPGLV